MSLASLPPSSQTLQHRRTYLHNHRRLFRRLILLALLAAVAGVLLLPVARKVKKKLFGPWPEPVPARVARITPADGSVNVSVNTTLRATIKFTRAGLDPLTLTPQSIHLYRAGDQARVAVEASLTPEGELVVRPQAPLAALTNYNLLVTPAVKDTTGASIRPFIMAFTTAGSPPPAVAFEKVELPATSGFMWTAVAMGPDGKLYAGCDDGRIYRFTLSADGTIAGEAELLDALRTDNKGPRLLTGFCFDPKSTPDNLVIYAANSFYAYENCPDLSGKITRLAGPSLAEVKDVVTGLPRSVGDHATNQPSFGPDGCLYIPQASNTAFGDADPIWGMRPEHKLNATVLRLDLAKLGDRTLDARTPDVGGSFDPEVPDSPMTVYAFGVRLAYDLLWHSNGHLYVPVNGASSGGNAPAGNGVPGLKAITTAEDDYLMKIIPGRYYGHPNPHWNAFVLNGGNPTSSYDFSEVCQYPEGTQPDPRWDRAAWVIGQHYSPNGVIEYKADHFDGALKGKMLICRYSRGKDILVVSLDADGKVADVTCQIPGLSGFENPLDIVEHSATGNLYVADLMAKKIVLCRPKN